MTLKLTAEIENALLEAARKVGTTPEALALECLRDHFMAPGKETTQPGPAGTLADFLAGHIGVLASAQQVPGGANMSEDTGKHFAAGLLQKRAQGRL